ncbi:MAG: rhomboid family intramembrane serine protease, partial [Bacillota bacterium]
EEKYGGANLLFVILLTALVTGICNVVLFPDVALLGASGVVFAFILLSSMASFSDGKIPLTFILIAVIYIGREVISAFSTDNISQFTHIIGGIVGAGCGYFLGK